MSATEVHDVTHLQSLRNRVSAAVPRLRHEANGFAAERLAQLGYIHADPERVYVMIEGKHSALPVTDAVVHMLEVPGARVDDGQGLFERDADGKLRSMTLRTFPHARPLSASTLLNAESNEAFIGRLIRAYDTFWHHARADVRKVVKSEFLAQVWWQRATRHMSVEQVNLAARVAGPIELRRLADASLSLEIDAPNARREWLRVMGHDTNLMTVSVDGRDPLLLIALYDDGLTVHGFNDRGALVRWYAAQTQNAAGRKRLLGALHTNATMTADDLAGSRIDADTRSETAPVDTFTLLEAAYESQRHTATETPTPASRSRTALLLMRTLSHIDLAFGVATWFVPGARMASLGLSVADAGVGVLGLAVAAADGDSELRNQGWQSLLSAIGAQGIAAAQYRTLGLLTGDAKYRYFVMDKPIASESLIPGLYRGNGQLYAGVDRMTRAYVEFDMQTGFFRAVSPRADARRPAKPGPLMRLTSGGHWRTVTQPAGTTPPLDDPFIAWRIDQGFRARHDALRDSRDALFQQARRAVAAGPAAALPEAAAARQWYLRLLKLEFMDSAEQDRERLGTLAGRIDEVENAVEAGLCSAISALAEEAHNIGARYLAITQRPRTYFSHVRTGLTRATALAAHYGPVHTIATRFNGMARLPPIVSESFMQDLGELGEASVPYLPKPFGIAPSRRLIDVFEGPSDTRRAFELTAGTRTLLLGRSFDESGVAQYYFMDPNVGLVIHNDLEALIGIVKTHLDAMAQTYGIARPTTTLAIEAAELDIDYLANMNWLNNVEEIIPLREAFDV